MRNRPKEATCQDCGAVYVKNSASQVRCVACQKARNRQKHREQQAKQQKKLYSYNTEAKDKNRTRKRNAKAAAEQLAEDVRNAAAAGLSYGVYMAKKSRTGGNR